MQTISYGNNLLSYFLTPCPLEGVIVANSGRPMLTAILPLRAPTFRGRGENCLYGIIFS